MSLSSTQSAETSEPAGVCPAQPGLSVLIVSYRTRALTLRCVESVLRELGPHGGEVLVLDNDSRDGTVEALRERFPRCRVLINAENLGFGRAQNQLAAEAKGRRLLVLNPDTRLHPGCLGKLNAWLDQHPDTAVAGPRTLDPDGSVQATCFRFPGLLGEFLSTSSLGPLLRHVPGLGAWLGLTPAARASGEVGYLQGSCLLFRRDAFEEMGGFDESYFLFSEEVDLQRRLRDRGWKRAFVAEAVITHDHGKSMEQDPIQNYVELYRSKLRYFGRHLSPTRFWIVKGLWTVFHLTRWWLLAGLAACTGRATWKCKASKHRAVLALLSGAPGEAGKSAQGAVE